MVDEISFGFWGDFDDDMVWKYCCIIGDGRMVVVGFLYYGGWFIGDGWFVDWSDVLDDVVVIRDCLVCCYDDDVVIFEFWGDDFGCCGVFGGWIVLFVLFVDVNCVGGGVGFV